MTLMTQNQDTTVLQTLSLHIAYGNRTLWSGLDLTLIPGELTAVTGPSGCGKSTLLHCIGLLEKPSGGTIYFGQRELARMRPGMARRFRRDHLGYLFQNYALIENATIAQNLDVALRAQGRRGKTARTAAKDSLQRVGLDGRERQQVSRLSGGEQQRVALARTLVKEPSLILADEPTGALDQDNATTVVSLLRSMADDGTAVIIATHDDRVRNQCDKTIEVDNYTA